jgi:hypothetical protein
MLNAITLSVVMLSVVMLSVIVLSVIVLSVVMVSDVPSLITILFLNFKLPTMMWQVFYLRGIDAGFAVTNLTQHSKLLNLN